MYNNYNILISSLKSVYIVNVRTYIHEPINNNYNNNIIISLNAT